MAQQRLRRLFQARETAQGAEIFGNPDLIDITQPLHLTPIQRVAILTEAFLPKVDGVSKTTYLTIRYLQETGREVLVFAPDCSVTSVGPSEVIPLPSVSMPGAAETRMALPNPMIARRLNEFQPDLIHLCSPALMSVNGMAVGRALNIPVLANYQTDLPGYAIQYGYSLLSEPLRSWLRYLHNGCHVNLVPSQAILSDLKANGFRRLHIWERGVNIERFNPKHRSQTMRESLLAGRDPNALLVIYVGRLATEKCVDLLRDIADLEGIALTIIGDGQLKEDLEAQFAGTGTVFTGYLYGDDLATAFASADVFVFPGANETFGQVVQEALASGLPGIVTERGGVHERVEQGQTGWVVDHNQAAFAEAVRRLRDDRTLLKQMSAQARCYAEARPWSAIMAQLEQYYASALERSRRFEQLFGYTTYHQPLSIGSHLLQRGIIKPHTRAAPKETL